MNSPSLSEIETILRKRRDELASGYAVTQIGRRILDEVVML